MIPSFIMSLAHMFSLIAIEQVNHSIAKIIVYLSHSNVLQHQLQRRMAVERVLIEVVADGEGVIRPQLVSPVSHTKTNGRKGLGGTVVWGCHLTQV